MNPEPRPRSWPLLALCGLAFLATFVAVVIVVVDAQQ